MNNIWFAVNVLQCILHKQIDTVSKYRSINTDQILQIGLFDLGISACPPASISFCAVQRLIPSRTNRATTLVALPQVCDSFDAAAKAVWTVAHEPGHPVQAVEVHHSNFGVVPSYFPDVLVN